MVDHAITVLQERVEANALSVHFSDPSWLYLSGRAVCIERKKPRIPTSFCSLNVSVEISAYVKNSQLVEINP